MTAGEDLSWIPATCPNGHTLGRGRVNLSWVWCDCRPDGGHHVARCRVNGCRAEPQRPPGCTGGRDQH
jgi:hypothetical protein